MKKKNIIILTLLAMCLMLTSTAHAVPIYNFDVVENISAVIIGGNNNNLIVDYNSEDVDVTYTFKITSPYSYLNNTPEIRYVRIIVDETELSCTNETMINDTVFATYCNHHLSASHHNTTVSFQFAMNIMPSDYEFEFAMIHATSDEPIILYRSGGGGSSYTYPNINKTCIIEVIKEWIEPLELIDDDEKRNDSTDDDRTEHKNDTIVDDTTSDDDDIQDDTDDKDDYSVYLIILIAIICILIIVWLMKRTEKQNDK